MAHFTLIFEDRRGQGRVGKCRLPWVAGKQLRAYLVEPALKENNLIAFSLRCKMYNSRKQTVRLTYTPLYGDFVVMTPVRN